MVSKTSAFIYHIELGLRLIVVLSDIYRSKCDKNDSGLSVLNGGGKVIGMLVGALDSEN